MKRIVPLILIAALLLPGCANRAQSGATGGALAGATIGALTAGNKVQGAAIGALAGLVLGYVIGNEWDKYDQQHVSNVLETSPSGQTTSWHNPDTNNYYEATPQPAYEKQGKLYRDVKLHGVVDGREETIKAKAYRNPDGTWTLVQ